MNLDLRMRAQRALQGRYKIEREIGRGGTAVVYRAVGVANGDLVAVKVLLPSAITALGVGRFVREAALAGALDHPNILPIHEAGESEGIPYCVMPCVEGESLRALLTPRMDRMARAVAIAALVADALQHAHARGIVHRDIKPENVLLWGDRVVVTDFGVGRALHAAGGGTLTETGYIVGTPEYMSPEQVAGDPGLDGQSDLYSLGLVLYEMLAGELPFAGTSVLKVMTARLVEHPRPLRDLRPDAPAGLTELVHRLLNAAPDDRPADAAEVAAALRRLPMADG